jgi:hypothetical protein
MTKLGTRGKAGRKTGQASYRLETSRSIGKKSCILPNDARAEAMLFIP